MADLVMALRPESLQETVQQLVAYQTFWVYAVLVVVSFIEGPILALVCGALIKAGVLPLLYPYLALMAGDLIGDVFWYSLGYYGGSRFVDRFGRYFSISRDQVNMIEDFFHRHTKKILIISKMTMGFGFALVTLFTAGLVRIPFKQYILLNAVGQFFWTAFLMSIGYVFGTLYLQVNGIIGKMSVVALFVLGLIAIFGIGKYFGRRFVGANAS